MRPTFYLRKSFLKEKLNLLSQLTHNARMELPTSHRQARLTLIQAESLLKNIVIVPNLLSYIPSTSTTVPLSKNVYNLIRSCTRLLGIYRVLNQPNNALSMYSLLKKHQLPTDLTFKLQTLYILLSSPQSPPSFISSIFTDVVTHHGLPTDKRFYGALLNYWASLGNMSQIQATLDHMKKVNVELLPSHSNAVLSGLLKYEKDPKKAYDLYKTAFAAISTFSNNLDIAGWTNLVRQSFLAGDLLFVKNIFGRLKQTLDPPPDVFLYTTLMQLCLMKKDYYTILRLYDELLEQKLVPNIHTFTVLIQVYLKQNNIPSAISCFHHFISLGIFPDAIIYHLFIRTYCKSDRHFMTAFSLYQDMISKGITPSGRTLVVLLKAAYDFENPKISSQLLQDLENYDECFKVSAIVAIVQYFGNKRDMGKARHMVQELTIRWNMPVDSAISNQILFYNLLQGNLLESRQTMVDAISLGRNLSERELNTFLTGWLINTRDLRGAERIRYFMQCQGHNVTPPGEKLYTDIVESKRKAMGPYG